MSAISSQEANQLYYDCFCKNENFFKYECTDKKHHKMPGSSDLVYVNTKGNIEFFDFKKLSKKEKKENTYFAKIRHRIIELVKEKFNKINKDYITTKCTKYHEPYQVELKYSEELPKTIQIDIQTLPLFSNPNAPVLYEQILEINNFIKTRVKEILGISPPPPPLPPPTRPLTKEILDVLSQLEIKMEISDSEQTVKTNEWSDGK